MFYRRKFLYAILISQCVHWLIVCIEKSLQLHFIHFIKFTPQYLFHYKEALPRSQIIQSNSAPTDQYVYGYHLPYYLQVSAFSQRPVSFAGLLNLLLRMSHSFMLTRGTMNWHISCFNQFIFKSTNLNVNKHMSIRQA